VLGSDEEGVLLQVWPALMAMYATHGDKLAAQYGGSGSMHRVQMRSGASLRDQVVDALMRLDDASRTPPSSPSRSRSDSEEVATLGGGMKNMFTAIKRFYNNTFTDSDKQMAMHLVLGVYDPASRHSKSPLWALGREALCAPSSITYPGGIAFLWMRDEAQAAANAPWDNVFSLNSNRMTSFDSMLSNDRTSAEVHCARVVLPFRAVSRPGSDLRQMPPPRALEPLSISVSNQNDAMYRAYVSIDGVAGTPALPDASRPDQWIDRRLDKLARRVAVLTEALRSHGIAFGGDFSDDDDDEGGLHDAMKRRRSFSA